jgi:flagellar motility protein MotE (MotC chaperone)
MIRRLRDFRLIPVVLAATICLFALKTFGLIFDGGYTLGELARNAGDDVDVTGAIASPSGAAKRSEPGRPPGSQPNPKDVSNKSWAQQMFNYPDTTGSSAPSKPSAPATPAKSGPAEPPPPAQQVAERPISKAERAILERLQERRMELDARARDLEMRESLIKAAEKRLEGRLLELKDAEARITTATQQKDEAEAARFKNLITMYENMKAKDAAKIFDRLDLRILVDVANQLNPRRMSDIMAQMSAESAERLTVELAARAKDKGQAVELPKIEGKPLTN